MACGDGGLQLLGGPGARERHADDLSIRPSEDDLPNLACNGGPRTSSRTTSPRTRCVGAGDGIIIVSVEWRSSLGTCHADSTWAVAGDWRRDSVARYRTVSPSEVYSPLDQTRARRSRRAITSCPDPRVN